MDKDEEREGKPIYKEGKIEVRTFPRGPDEHNVWVGEHYFLLQHGCLEQFALKTPPEDLRGALANYNPSIPFVLNEERVSPKRFALILARARIKELDVQLSDAYGQIHSLHDRIARR